MAVEAPTHSQRFMLINYVHMVNVAVAADAANSTINVHRVIEVGEVGYLMNPHPIHGLSSGPTLLNRPQLRIVFLDLLMAIHASLRGRHIRRRGDLNVAVAVTAIHAELVHVNLVREWHRLHRLVTLPHVLRREVPPISGGRSSSDDEETEDNFDC